MKKILVVATLLIAASAQAESPNLGKSHLCAGLDRQTPEVVQNILTEVESNPDRAAGIRRGIERLNDREALLNEFCAGSRTNAHALIANARADLANSAVQSAAIKVSE